MNRILIAVLVAALVPAAAEAQGRRGGPPRSDLQNPNRRALERQILQRFVEQSGQEMGLNTNARTELGRILDDTNEERRTLAVEAAQLRQKLAEALRDTRSTNDQFEEILDDIGDLRQREHELWRREQDRLARTLTPRQRALFMNRWLRLQDNIRDLIEQRPGGAGIIDTTLLEALYSEAPVERLRGGG